MIYNAGVIYIGEVRKFSQLQAEGGGGLIVFQNLKIYKRII